MSTSQKSLADRSLRWSQLSEKGPDLTAEMPELRETVDELRGLSQEVSALTAQQSHHLAQARIVTARIRALAKRADHLRGRVGASLRGKYGFDSSELIRYGFKSRKQMKKDHVDRELADERKARAEAEAEGTPGEGGEG